MLEKMEDKAQKRIVELGITEAQRARDYSRGYCDGYLEGLLDATNRAADIVLKNDQGYHMALYTLTRLVRERL